MDVSVGAVALTCRACGHTVRLLLEVTVGDHGDLTVEPTSQALTMVDAFAAMHRGPFGVPLQPAVRKAR